MHQVHQMPRALALTTEFPSAHTFFQRAYYLSVGKVFIVESYSHDLGRKANTEYTLFRARAIYGVSPELVSDYFLRFYVEVLHIFKIRFRLTTVPRRILRRTPKHHQQTRPMGISTTQVNNMNKIAKNVDSKRLHHIQFYNIELRTGNICRRRHPTPKKELLEIKKIFFF